MPQDFDYGLTETNGGRFELFRYDVEQAERHCTVF